MQLIDRGFQTVVQSVDSLILASKLHIVTTDNIELEDVLINYHARRIFACVCNC